MANFHPNSLVLYKRRPARVLNIKNKLEIELEDGNKAKVRSKDIQLLHPGPIDTLNELGELRGEVKLAWEMLCCEHEKVLSISELAEWIYGDYTPSTAWAAWELMDDGLYFRGTPDAVKICSPLQVEQEIASRQAKAEQARRLEDFKDRVKMGEVNYEYDREFLAEINDFAYGRRANSRLLRELNRTERPENAHALLLDLGYWDHFINPHPTRLGLPLIPPEFDLPILPEENRLDLTHLETYAIDDRDNQDPDDAISLEYVHFDDNGEFLSARIWVHIADAAALITPNSLADLEARSRGATLYLAEGIVPMLPLSAVERLGMGLQEISPALSFGMELNAHGEIVSAEIRTSWVRVLRLSYEEAELLVEEGALKDLYQATKIYQARRRANGALSIDLPEVILRLIDGQVKIRPVQDLRSRALVQEAMLMAGETAAQFAIQNQLPFPFTTQEAPDRGRAPHTQIREEPTIPGDTTQPAKSPTTKEEAANRRIFRSTATEDLVRQYSLRRTLKRSQVSGIPHPHAGVGLPAYTRVTSPLRRYMDLAAHQQLRAHLTGGAIIDEGKMLERIGASEAAANRVTQVEALTRRHWTLVFLLQNPDWRGEGIIVEKTATRDKVIIPELALEFSLSQNMDLPLGARISLTSPTVNLPELEVHFQSRIGETFSNRT